MVIISDGEERDSYYKYKEMLSLFNGSDIQVFMLSYAFQASLKKKVASKFADKIVFETGGLVLALTEKRTKQDIVNTLKALMIELRSNFVISYTSTNQKRDGLPRKLRIEVADSEKAEKRQGFIREGFIVPKN